MIKEILSHTASWLPSAGPATILAGLLACAASALGSACTDTSGDSGSPDDPGAAPLVAGNYQVTILGATGCEGEVSWVDDWATGPLEVEQPSGGNELEFDFGYSYHFSGSIDSYGRYLFAGVVTYNDAELDIDNEGAFSDDPSYDDPRWIIEGEFTVEVDDDEFDTNNCTMTSPFTAVQLVDL